MEYARGNTVSDYSSDAKPLGIRDYEMVGYELYLRDPIKGYQLVGVLPERRRNPKRITKESVLNWGKKYFAKQMNPNEMFFIEVEINGESIRTL